MKRVLRHYFLFCLCLGFVFSLTAFPISSTSIFSQKVSSLTTEIRGVWFTNIGSSVLFIPWGIHRATDQLASLNFNTIYPLVWNRGYTFYKSAVAQTVTGDEIQTFMNFMHGGKDVLAKLVNSSKSKDINIIPWFEYGFITPHSYALAMVP